MNYSPFKPGDKIVGYCRCSGGEEQGLKNTSTDEQEAAIRRFCEENRLILVKVYADPFVSGRSTKGREHYLEMMSDLLHDKKHKSGVAGLIAWDIDRHNRNYDKIFQKSGMFCSLKNQKKSPKSGSFLTVFCRSINRRIDPRNPTNHQIDRRRY